MDFEELLHVHFGTFFALFLCICSSLHFFFQWIEDYSKGGTDACSTAKCKTCICVLMTTILLNSIAGEELMKQTLLLLSLSLCTVLLFGCGKEKQPEPQPTVPQVSKSLVEQDIERNGNSPYELTLHVRVKILDENGELIPDSSALVALRMDEYDQLRKTYGDFVLLDDWVRLIPNDTPDYDPKDPLNIQACNFVFQNVPLNLTEKDYFLEVKNVQLPKGYTPIPPDSKSIELSSTSLSSIPGHIAQKRADVTITIHTEKTQ